MQKKLYLNMHWHNKQSLLCAWLNLMLVHDLVVNLRHLNKHSLNNICLLCLMLYLIHLLDVKTKCFYVDRHWHKEWSVICAWLYLMTTWWCYILVPLGKHSLDWHELYAFDVKPYTFTWFKYKGYLFECHWHNGWCLSWVRMYLTSW
jgi:hypothetical protein